MKDAVRITLKPLGTEITVRRGTSLHDVLFSYGVEFPCGGRARCKGCRVRVTHGSLPVTPEQQRMLSPDELDAGWRLSCQCSAGQDLTLELAQWEAAILSDDSPFSFTPQPGHGIAVDVGTTTLVAQLLDLRQGKVLAVRTALNPQARYGADIMSRVSCAVLERGQQKLVSIIRKQVGKMIVELLEAATIPQASLVRVVLVGNTVMHHLFSDFDLSPLSAFPFESDNLQVFRTTARHIGWEEVRDAEVVFLPCIGGFVGSDILAGILAMRLHESTEMVGLVDLGTNGEIVIGNRDDIICASTAAGPAFEGARISMGMRAATGAIAEVDISSGALVCHVLGNVPPRGICGSGLVDAAAACLDLGLLRPNGRLANNGAALVLSPPVQITQTDVRELQLAKGAIAAGVRILLRAMNTTPEKLARLYLAGAFGNYVNTTSAQRIGLLSFPTEKVRPSGNTALIGAKMGLFLNDAVFFDLARRIRHVTLSEQQDFQEIYVEEMNFPE